MSVAEGFQKFAGIPFGISRIFEGLRPQQVSANRCKNRSIQVYFSPGIFSFTLLFYILLCYNINVPDER